MYFSSLLLAREIYAHASEHSRSGRCVHSCLYGTGRIGCERGIELVSGSNTSCHGQEWRLMPRADVSTKGEGARSSRLRRGHARVGIVHNYCPWYLLPTRTKIPHEKCFQTENVLPFFANLKTPPPPSKNVRSNIECE